MRKFARSVALPIHRYLFARKWLYKLNKALLLLNLRAIGILNFDNDTASGEKWLLDRISHLIADSDVIDVGANVGDYSNKIKLISPTSRLYSFEPHPKTFEILKSQSVKHAYEAFNVGCGSENHKTYIHDYEGIGEAGTSHASLYEEAISQLRDSRSRRWQVELIKLDDFIHDKGIDRIRLIKIDVEGGEMEVLAGMKQALKANKIDLIQFEFNEINVFSRVFLRDIRNLLPMFHFYRLLPRGAISLGKYAPVSWEIFAYQNIVAVNNSFSAGKNIFE